MATSSFVMKTHSYSRPLQAPGSGSDSYNPLVNSLSLSPQGPPTEYWTNGTTTQIHIVASSPAVAADSSSFSSSSSLMNTTLDRSAASQSRAMTVARKRSLSQTAMSTTTNSTAPGQKPSHLVVYHSILAGSCAGMTSTACLYPADVLRTKLQASGSSSAVRRGPFAVLRHTLQHGGVRALYTGLSLPLAGQAVYKSTVFAVNNVTSEWLLAHKHLEHQKLGTTGSTRPQLTYLDRFFCGFCGGAVNAACFVTPVEFVRNQMIAQHSQTAAGEALSHAKFRTSLDVIRHAFQQPAGLRMLWRGAGLCVARDSFGCGMFFYTMKWTEDMLMAHSSWEQEQRHRATRKPSFLTNLIAGGAGGLAFWVSALPLDTMKTWVQSSTDWKVQVSPTQVLRRIYYEHGLKAVVERLFRGWQVAYGRGVPSAAITISVYSMMYRYVQQQDETHQPQVLPAEESASAVTEI